MDLSYKEINDFTHKVIGAAMAVHRKLGSGFLEKVYENALAIELKSRGIPFVAQKKIYVHYGDEIVGDYTADILVDDWLLLELKAVKSFSGNEESQCVNYLTALKLDVCLLINFGETSLRYKRVVQKDVLDKINTQQEKIEISRINSQKNL